MKPLTLLEFEIEFETGAFVLDFRTADEFSEGFIPESYFICPAFLNTPICHEVISIVENITIIAPEHEENRSIKALEQHGYQQIAGWLKGGFETWKENGKKIDVIISIEADELMLDMKYDNPQVIDIRSEAAYNALHLEDAENIPIANLIFNLEELPRNGVYYLYCDDGNLSLSIISCLKSQGFHNFYHIKGGFKALLQSEASTVSSER
jgi:hydroxyacylglutathione hydrolase